MSTPSRTIPYCGQLEGAEGGIARTLLGGDASSIAKAALAVNSVRKAIISVLLNDMNDECRKLCRKKPTCTLFRKCPVDKLAKFKWKDMIDELKNDRPLLFTIISSLVSHNNSRNNQGWSCSSSWNLFHCSSATEGEESRDVWASILDLTSDVFLPL